MVEVPLQLWNRPHWELTGRADSVRFFRALKTAFPTATTLSVEGTSIALDVQEFFRGASEAGRYLPAKQTIWPRPTQFRLPADDPTMKRWRSWQLRTQSRRSWITSSSTPEPSR